MAGTRFTLGLAKGQTLVPGMTNKNCRPHHSAFRFASLMICWYFSISARTKAVN